MAGKAPQKRQNLAVSSSRNYELGDLDCALGWKDIESSGNQAVFRHFEKLRSRAQDLARNNDYAQAFLRRLRDNVVGKEGINFQSRIKFKGGGQKDRLDKKFNGALEELWKASGKKKNKPTACGQHSRRSLQQFIIQNVVVDGEVFILHMPGSQKNRFAYTNKIIDPARVDCNVNRERANGVNAIKMGVELDEDDMPIAYWVLEYHPNEHFVGGGATQHRHVRVSADQMTHVFIPERAGQVRGITHLASGALKAHLLAQFEKACVISARNGAAKMGFFMVDQEKAENLGVLGNTEDGSGKDAESVNDESTIREELAFGSMDQLPSYVTDVKTFDPNTPPPRFEEFEKRMIRGMASSFGDQYHAIANDLEGVNFTSSRTGELSQRDVWQNWQIVLIENFLEPDFERWAEIQLMNNQVTLDKKKTRELLDFDRYCFKGRGWAWVDPKKQVDANAAAVENSFKTRRDVIYEESGRDFEDVMDELAEEKEYMESKGLNPEPNAKPEPVPPAEAKPPEEEED